MNRNVFLYLVLLFCQVNLLTAQSTEHDFDFLIEGDWEIKNRRLKEWLSGSNEWLEFTSSKKDNTAVKILGGLGNLDEVVIERNQRKVYGMGIRLFNPKSNFKYYKI